MDEQEPQQQFRSRRSYVYDSNGGKKNRKKIFAIIGGIIIVIVVLIIGSAVFSGGEPEEEEDIFSTPAITQEPTETPTPTSEDEEENEEEGEGEDSDPTPTEESEEEVSDTVDEASGLDRADYSILIQNGSGTAGAAGRLSDTLSDLGYEIASTENADNFDYQETEVSVANGNEALLGLIEEDIGDDYTIGDTSTDYDGSADAVIIIGAE